MPVNPEGLAAGLEVFSPFLMPVQAALFLFLLFAVSFCDLKWRIIPDGLQLAIAANTFLCFSPGNLLGILLGWLLTTIPDSKRIYSIENGSRELALVRRNEAGQVTNSVIHMLTRDSENERQRVDQIALLDMALRFNPDVIMVGEMRGSEANAAQEAARTGVAVVTTIHLPAHGVLMQTCHRHER